MDNPIGKEQKPDQEKANIEELREMARKAGPGKLTEQPCKNPCYTDTADTVDTTNNWKHRSKSMKCGTCMYYITCHHNAIAGTIGRCRRHAPTTKGFPVVFANDWCGDHKLDETKM